MRCLIVSNGRIEHYHKLKDAVEKSDRIICADGGANHLFNINKMPHTIIGDLDSITPECRDFFIKKKVEIITFPTSKDKSDTELALDLAVSMNPSLITFAGATGSRMDHTLSNIFLLQKLLDTPIQASILDENNEIFMVKEKITVTGKPGDHISILPVSERVTGITLQGVKFPLVKADIEQGSSLGISNVFLENHAEISVESGSLLVILSRD